MQEPEVSRAIKSMVQIHVERWRFWSPESDDPGLWLKHWRQPGAEREEGDPDVKIIPAAHRRRSSRLTKIALSAALGVVGSESADYSIFCSQHGEIVRTRDILSCISNGREISPAAFSQSVHNTSSGLFTIIAATNAPSISMASGANSFAYGWMEAQVYLTCNPTHTILLVDFDEVIPDEYQHYEGVVACDRSLALLLRVADKGGIVMKSAALETEARLPQGPQFLAWLQSDSDSLQLSSDRQGWQWQR